MSFFTREQRYTMLCAIKRGARTGHSPLTAEEEQFIQDYAFEKLTEVLNDPEVMAVMKRILDDVEKCAEKDVEQSWRDNPDRMGGQFTQDEIDNANRW